MLISRGWTVDVGANIGERSGDMMDGMIAMEQKINEAALDMISQKRVQYNIAQTLYLWEKFSLYTLTKSVKIPSISNKLGTDFTVVRVPQIDPSVALFPV